MPKKGKANARFQPRAGVYPNPHLQFKNTMKHKVILGLVLAIAGSVLAAESNSKEEVADAAKKLAEASNYSWKTTSQFNNFSGTTEGKANKDGLVSLSMSFGDNTTEAFLKGSKGAVKTPEDPWQSLAELEAATGTDPGQRQFLLRRLQGYKAPSAEALDLTGKTKEITKQGDVYSADLTDDGAKELLSFGRRGANASGPKNAKGSVKFWVKSGALSKYELKLQGTVNFNGEDRDVDRTTTVEIKDVGTTKLEVLEAAKKKLE